MSYILGISAFFHDSAACLLKDGVIIAAAQEERFTRIKHDASFPTHAIAYCLKEAGITVTDLKYVSYYEKPFLTFERILHSYFEYAPKGLSSFIKAIPSWIKKKIWLKDIIIQELGCDVEIFFPEHHISHAASAYYPSSFRESAFLTVDGVGEWATTSYGIGEDNKLRILADIQFPHSIGLLYSSFTYFAGFKVNSGEYKLMGLAPYGEPKYVDTIKSHLIHIKDDGSFRLNMAYFDYPVGLAMTNKRFNGLFGGGPREPEAPITQREMDLARSVQAVVEEVILNMAKHIKNVTGKENLCLAGGVALNCVANGKLVQENIFKDIFIQPAAGDAGGALGAAMYVWHHCLDKPRNVSSGQDSMQGSFLGPQYSTDEIKSTLVKYKASFEEFPDSELLGMVADIIASGQVVGWFQGRLEFGPRALGARSILGDPRSGEMQKTMNLKIKFRESFRPFAPSIREEDLSDYFKLDCPSPYMLLVADVNDNIRNQPSGENKTGLELLNEERSEVPAVTHVDFSARIQTVNEGTNPKFHGLLTEMKNRHGCPLLVNTSFNVRGEPNVCSPEDAYLCFMRTGMDYLVMENLIFAKKDQPALEGDENWREKFSLD